MLTCLRWWQNRPHRPQLIQIWMVLGGVSHFKEMICFQSRHRIVEVQWECDRMHMTSSCCHFEKSAASSSSGVGRDISSLSSSDNVQVSQNLNLSQQEVGLHLARVESIQGTYSEPPHQILHHWLVDWIHWSPRKFVSCGVWLHHRINCGRRI